MKFSEHAQSLTQKVSFGIHVIIKTRPYFSTEILLSLYYAFIHSHLSYCLSSWGNTYWSHIGHLERLQKQALRLITFNPFSSPSAPIFRSLSILPLRKLVSHKILIIMFRVLNHELYISSFSDVTLVNTNNTRFSTNRNLLLPKVRTNYGRMTTRFSCVTLWNKLPFDLKSCTMHAFCKRLKIELLNDLWLYCFSFISLFESNCHYYLCCHTFFSRTLFFCIFLQFRHCLLIVELILC